MLIEIEVDRAGGRRFHLWLRDALGRRVPEAKVWIRAVEGAGAPAASVATLLYLERMVLRRSQETLCDPVPAAAFDAPAMGSPDIVLDLSGRPPANSPTEVRLRPLFDGDPSEETLIAALLNGAAPEIVIENGSSGQILCAGVPSLEAADGLTGGMEAVFSRAMLLIVKAILAPETALFRSPREVRPARSLAAARAGVRSVLRLAARAIYHLCCHAPHWRIGWRLHDGPGVIDTGRLDGPKWQVLADPGRRFFADPFPIAFDGRRYLFFEDLDHRIGKGVISAIEFGPDGPIGEATPVLEEPWHLSYPSLIEADGQLWMVPEGSKSGRILLYRCVRFPTRWERFATLVDDIEAADPTLISHAGLFYMMSAVRENVGGYSDTLAIHYAASLLGPWSPHALRPVLIDGRAARPGGAMVRKGGALWRPVQDCAQIYGRALRLARLDRLDPENFEQTFTATIESSSLWPGGRLHTLNRCGALECIDGVSIAPKVDALRFLVDHFQQPLDPDAAP
jgi:hypothetical protein